MTAESFCLFRGIAAVGSWGYTPPAMYRFRVPLVLSLFLFTAITAAQNTTTAKARRAVATVGGQTIYEDELVQAAEGQLSSLRNQEYEIKKKALDGLIEQKLIEAAAKGKGLTTEKLLDQEVNSKIPDPSDAEVEGYYYGLKVTRPLAEVRTQLRGSLKQAKIQQARQEYLKGLREQYKAVVLLQPPRVDVAFDPARLRGNAKAPVMIVEFSDYQCPYCRSVEPTVKDVLAKYGDKVSFSYRDFPLTAIHSQAMIAAEASRCALEQGKFWEYHDQLFASSKLEKDTLVEYARGLKLNDKQFEACVTSEKYKADIEKDQQDGRKAGVNGTPGFFINGVELSGAQGREAFERLIDEELARKNIAKSVTVSVTPVER